MMAVEPVLRNGLPSDVGYEKWILGAVVMNAAENLSLVRDILTPADFAVEYNRIIFQHLLLMAEEGQKIDRGTLNRSLFAAGKIEAAGGIGYVNDLDNGMPEVHHLDSYCEAVHEKSLLRQAIIAAHAGIATLCSHGATLDDLEVFKERIAGIEDDSKNRRGGFRHIAEIIANEDDGGVTNFINPPIDKTGVPWPWEGLTQMIGPLAPGQVVCLSAASGVGKTTMLTQAVLHAANLNYPSAILTLEMTSAEQAKKIISQHGATCLAYWLRGVSSRDDRKRIVAAIKHIQSRPIYFDDREDVTPVMLRTAIERMKEKPAVVGVDYAQMMDSGIRDKGASREQHVAYISRSIKKMAKKYNCAFIVLSQLNEEGKTRESRALEHDSTFHLKLERKAGGLFHLSCPKARFAAYGKHIELYLDGETGLFTEAGGVA